MEAVTWLVDSLRRQNLVLERLVFKLVELRLLLETGRGQMGVMAADEVVRLEERLGQLELMRAVAAGVVAEGLGLEEDASGGAIAARLGSPFGDLLADQLLQVADLLEEAEGLRRLAREAAERGREATRQAIRAIEEGGDGRVGYGADGKPATAGVTAGLVSDL